MIGAPSSTANIIIRNHTQTDRMTHDSLLPAVQSVHRAIHRRVIDQSPCFDLLFVYKGQPDQVNLFLFVIRESTVRSGRMTQDGNPGVTACDSLRMDHIPRVCVQVGAPCRSIGVASDDGRRIEYLQPVIAGHQGNQGLKISSIDAIDEIQRD